jgi:hypothetical protein
MHRRGFGREGSKLVSRPLSRYFSVEAKDNHEKKTNRTRSLRASQTRNRNTNHIRGLPVIGLRDKVDGV